MLTIRKIHDIKTPSLIVLAVALSQDCALCAAGDRDGVTHIIDMASGEIVRHLKQHVEFVYAMTVEPKTGHLLTTGKDKSIREWNMEPGACIRDYAGIFTSASARTLNAQSFKPSTKSHTKTVLCIECADNDLMATGGQDCNVKYWSKGEPYRSFSWHDGPVVCVRFQPETLTLFSGSKDKTIRSWNVENGAMIHKYSGHRDEVVSFFFRNKDEFLSVDNAGTVLVWNVEKEQSLGELFFAPDQARCMGYDKDIDLVIIGLNDGRIVGVTASHDDKIEVKKPEFMISDHKFAVRSLAVSNGKLVSCDEEGKVKIWNIESC